MNHKQEPEKKRNHKKEPEKKGNHKRRKMKKNHKKEPKKGNKLETLDQKKSHKGSKEIKPFGMSLFHGSFTRPLVHCSIFLKYLYFKWFIFVVHFLHGLFCTSDSFLLINFFLFFGYKWKSLKMMWHFERNPF